MSATADLRATVVGVLAEIAPEADLATLPDDADLREQLDLDSMDVQRLVAGIYEATGIDVPERDYGRLASVAATVDYLARAAGQP